MSFSSTIRTTISLVVFLFLFFWACMCVAEREEIKDCADYVI